MKITKKAKPKIVKKRSKRQKATEDYTLREAFLDALMYLPNQEARKIAQEAFFSFGPGAIDPKEAARSILIAAKESGWECWRAIGKMTDYVEGRI